MIYFENQGNALAGELVFAPSSHKYTPDTDGLDTPLPTGTDGDPMLRGANLAPDTSDETLDPDRAGAKGLNADLSDDVVETPGDETPGTALNPH